MFLIQPRRKGAYSENNLFGAARVLRPDRLRHSVRSPREILRKALSQLAWAHSKAVEATQRPSSRGSRTTPMSTPVDEGDLFMSHPRSPAKTCSNFSRLPLTWYGAAWSQTSPPSAANSSPPWSRSDAHWQTPIERKARGRRIGEHGLESRRPRPSTQVGTQRIIVFWEGRETPSGTGVKIRSSETLLLGRLR